MLVGTQYAAMHGVATVLPEFDFETYSEAGYVWGVEPGYWKKAPKKKPLDAVLDPSGTWIYVPPQPRLEGLPGAAKRRGLGVVGTYNYVMHPTFRVISLAYNLKDGRGARLWKPGMPPPQDLLDWIASGGLIEAWNIFFEVTVWLLYCVEKLGWPLLRLEQTRCCMAKAAMAAYPRKLEHAGGVLRLINRKDDEGGKLINLLTVPKNPTKADGGRCWTPETKPEEFRRFYSYNVQDIMAESEASLKLPDLNPRELRVWRTDQRINHRGMQIDLKAVEDGIAIVEQATNRYNAELLRITHGAVKSSSEVAKTIEWLQTQGVYLPDLDEETVEEELLKQHPAAVLRVLKIRQTLAFGSVKKLYGMRLQACPDGRLRDQFAYASAHTQLWNGQSVQVMNLFKGKFNKPEQVELALGVLASRDLDYVEKVFANGPPWDPKDNDKMEALDVVANCLRSMIVARTGARLISADYSAIQAVVTAALAGEKWQLDVFHAGKSLYLATASQMTGKTVEFYEDYYIQNGKKHHPERQTHGKVPTLAGGFAAWIGGYRRFGAEGTDKEVKQLILTNRSKIPATVEFWGGQTRNKFNKAPDGSYAPAYQQYFGIEGAAIRAVLEPGRTFGYRGVRYTVFNDVLYCMPPGPEGMSPLVYHEPRLTKAKSQWANPWEYDLTYVGWNTSQTKGKGGWERMGLYGGLATQNVVAKVAREFQADTLCNLDETDLYLPVHHAHDENVTEVEDGRGSVDEYLSIVNRPQPWAIDDWGRPWPVKAPAAEETHRYGKWE